MDPKSEYSLERLGIPVPAAVPNRCTIKPKYYYLGEIATKLNQSGNCVLYKLHKCGFSGLRLFGTLKPPMWTPQDIHSTFISEVRKSILDREFPL